MTDDDNLQDGADVPMPDYSELGAAMAEAFVDVLIHQHDHDVPFLLHAGVSNDEIVAAQRWDSVGDNAAPCWVAYLLGAHQGPEDQDHDPANDTGAQCFGVTPSDGRGGSLVFIETIHDRAYVFYYDDPVLHERNMVVHEVGHAFGRSAHPVTIYEDQGNQGPIRYVEDYLKQIRSVEKPDSR